MLSILDMTDWMNRPDIINFAVSHSESIIIIVRDCSPKIFC